MLADHLFVKETNIFKQMPKTKQVACTRLIETSQEDVNKTLPEHLWQVWLGDSQNYDTNNPFGQKLSFMVLRSGFVSIRLCRLWKGSGNQRNFRLEVSCQSGFDQLRPTGKSVFLSSFPAMCPAIIRISALGLVQLYLSLFRWYFTCLWMSKCTLGLISPTFLPCRFQFRKGN